MAERLSADEAVRLAAQAGREAYEDGLRSGLPVVTSDERAGMTYMDRGGRKFAVELAKGRIRIISEFGRDCGEE